MGFSGFQKGHIAVPMGRSEEEAAEPAAEYPRRTSVLARFSGRGLETRGQSLMFMERYRKHNNTLPEYSMIHSNDSQL